MWGQVDATTTPRIYAVPNETQKNLTILVVRVLHLSIGSGIARKRHDIFQ